VDGWNAVRSARYDLVVSDVDMPRMNGIQLVAHIKEDARLKEIPVIIVSYKDREEDRIRGLDVGANSYLTKSSFHDQTFLDTIVDLIGEAGS
jgi:two-component system sensor histidine kinase and response regulator WspE